MNSLITYTENQIAEVASLLLEKIEEIFVLKSVIAIGLTGDLGAGKTTLCKHLLKPLQVKENIISPTFVLRKDYTGIWKGENVDVIHIDAYRLENKNQINQVINLQDLNTKTIIIVEWAELAGLSYDMHFHLKYIDESTRQIEML